MPSNLSASSQTFNYNYTPTQASACEIYLDDILNQTTASPIPNATLSFIINNIDDDSHSWYVRCNNTDNSFYYSDIWMFNMSALVANTCTSPASGNWNINCGDNCSWASNQSIPANVSINGTGNINLSAWWNFQNKKWRIAIKPEGSGCRFKILKEGGIR